MGHFSLGLKRASSTLRSPSVPALVRSPARTEDLHFTEETSPPGQAAPSMLVAGPEAHVVRPVFGSVYGVGRSSRG